MSMFAVNTYIHATSFCTGFWLGNSPPTIVWLHSVRLTPVERSWVEIRSYNFFYHMTKKRKVNSMF